MEKYCPPYLHKASRRNWEQKEKLRKRGREEEKRGREGNERNQQKDAVKEEYQSMCLKSKRVRTTEPSHFEVSLHDHI
jgi:hypothetical protein